MGKISSATLLSIILLIMELGICCFARNSTFGCIERERKALLRFRESLLDPSNILSSWNWKNRDCCKWQGVKCDHITRHVIRLELRFSDTTSDYMFKSKAVDSSLLELKSLRYLDLSWIDFNHSKIPAFLGSMKRLQHLNLSNSNFNGIVPHHLGNLSSLRILDLSSSSERLIVDDLTWAIKLSSLEHVDMSSVNLSLAKDIDKVLQMLPSLVKLRLSDSGLAKTHLLHACVNSTFLANVQYLDLSANWFHGEFPCFLQNMTSLRFLDLSGNMFNFSGTHLLGLKNLAHLELGYNTLHHKAGWISEFLWDRCNLESLNLEHNYLYGDISGLFKNLSGCISHSLESLNLGSNEFQGHLPEELGELQQLTELDISYNRLSGSIPLSLGNVRSLRVLWLNENQLTGEIPISLGQLSNLESFEVSSNRLSGQIPLSLGNLRSLRKLRLSENRLSGQIPISLGQLSNLETIDVSFNSFKGTLSEAHFAKLSKLQYIWADFTTLKFGVGYDWVPPFQLKELSMVSSKIGGQFPQWLQTQKALKHLDLWNCSITGSLPKWLRSMNSLTELYLSYNNITGPIPELPSNLILLYFSDNMITHFPSNIGHMMPLLKYLDLSRNFINGSIPDSLCELKALVNLYLSNNRLSGNLPDCWPNLQQLQGAKLSSNELSGVIPNSIGGAYSLKWLHLNDNNLIGKLPSTLKNCKSLLILNVGGNSLSGKLPEWIGKGLFDLEVLILRDNEFYGTIPSAFCQLFNLKVMDLANNKLTGNIPHCFANFSAMMIRHVFTGNEWNSRDGFSQVMKGMELEYTTNSRYIVNLDLSSNHLAGEIPLELTTLSGLNGLNLSHNHLEGEIPARIGDLVSLESLDLSNNILFGKTPDSLSNLSFLSRLNLSNNNLSGQIPIGRQLQTLDDPSIYDGNPQLCGAPLLKKCDEAPILPNVENHEAEDGDRAEKMCFYAVVIGGFATGFWGIIGVLVIKTKWRQAYFRYIEVVIDKVLGY